VRLLIDTNIVLELVLEQAKADELRALLVRSDEAVGSDLGCQRAGLPYQG